jgi:hypothetical protein
LTFDITRLEGQRLALTTRLEADQAWSLHAVVGPDGSGQPCLERLELRPTGTLPQGGLTATVWRLVRIGELGREAVDVWRQVTGDLKGWNPEAARVLKEWPTHRTQVPESYYALLAEAFSRRISEGSREPINDLHRWLDVPRSTIDRRINRARDLQLLEYAPAGAWGGRLTARGRRALRESKPKE